MKKIIGLALILMLLLLGCIYSNSIKITEDNGTLVKIHKNIYTEQIDIETGVKYVEGELIAINNIINKNEESVNVEYSVKTNIDGSDIYFSFNTRGVEEIYENIEAKEENKLWKIIRVEYKGDLRLKDYCESEKLESYSIKNPIRIIFVE